MNRRQKKKKSKNKITIIIKTEMMVKPDEYERMRRGIENQMNKSNVVLLPPYLKLIAIIQQPGSRRVEIKQDENAEILQKHMGGGG